MDSKILKEYTRVNAQEMMSSESEFTISYEIELAAKEQMRPENVKDLKGIESSPEATAKKEAYFLSPEEKKYLILNLFRIEPTKLADSKYVASMFFMRVLRDEISTEDIKETILNVAQDLTGREYVSEFFKAFEIDDTNTMVELVQDSLVHIGKFLDEVAIQPRNIKDLLESLNSTIARGDTGDEARWVLGKLKKHLAIAIAERVGQIEGRTVFASGDGDNYNYKNVQDPVFIAYLQHFLPNFMNKWEDRLKIEVEYSFLRGQGVEFSMKKYLNGIDEAFEFLDDLYTELDAQDFFFMKEDLTGLHINIGTTAKRPYNLMKGFLYLDEEQKGGGSMARRGLSDARVFSRWAGTVKDVAYLKILETIETLIEEEPEFWYQGIIHDLKRSLKNPEAGLSSIEKILSNCIFNAAQNKGAKDLGFNVLYTRGRDGDSNISYVEFRYPGGVVDSKTMKDLTLYYCYLVLLMSDPDFKKNDYLSKLVGFLNKVSTHQMEVVGKRAKLFRAGMGFYVGGSFNLDTLMMNTRDLEKRKVASYDIPVPIKIRHVYSLVDIISVKDEYGDEESRSIRRAIATKPSHMMEETDYVPVMVKIKDVKPEEDEYLVSFFYVDQNLEVKEYESWLASFELLEFVYINLNDEIFEADSLVDGYKLSKDIARTYDAYAEEVRKGIKFSYDIEQVQSNYRQDQDLKNIKQNIITLVKARDKGTISQDQLRAALLNIKQSQPEAAQKYKALFGALLGN